MGSSKTYTVDEALKRMENYCAYQERCHKEVEEKLVEMRLIPEAKEKIILHLIENNFLNETRFALAFARGKFRIKKWGKQRISRELKFRNISIYNIKIALEQINSEDYEATLAELAQHRLQQITEKDKYKKRKKLADYLLYRGWESDLVYNKVTNLIP
ncbi:MAG TPA: RecX family transcriptional regulator [Flavobacteriaceae bacterium]|nr:RecX family transcriptional regulator [Flavobacteriaceae bacterium]